MIFKGHNAHVIARMFPGDGSFFRMISKKTTIKSDLYLT